MNPFNMPLSGTAVTPLFNIPVNGPPSQGVPLTPDAAPAQAGGTERPRRNGRHTGFAGVARDILGTLGDFLLTRFNMPAMYAPAQRERRLREAVDGFETDPLAAIDRVTDVDFDRGTALRNQYLDNQRLDQSRLATEEAAQARIALAQERQAERTRGIAASLLNTLSNLPEDQRAQAYAIHRDRVIRSAKRSGYNSLADDLPETYDPSLVDAFIDSAVPVGTQRSQRLTAQRNEVLREQGDARITETREGRIDRTETTRRGQDINDGNRDADRDARRDIAGGRNTITREGQAERARANRARERRDARRDAQPRPGQIVTMPDGSRRRIRR